MTIKTESRELLHLRARAMASACETVRRLDEAGSNPSNPLPPLMETIQRVLEAEALREVETDAPEGILDELIFIAERDIASALAEVKRFTTVTLGRRKWSIAAIANHIDSEDLSALVHFHRHGDVPKDRGVDVAAWSKRMRSWGIEIHYNQPLPPRAVSVLRFLRLIDDA